MGRGKISVGIVVSFFAGIVVGIVICLAIGAALYYSKDDTVVPGFPERFGEIEIIGVESIEDEEDDWKMLMLRKDKMNFFGVEEDKDGKVRNACVVDNNDIVRFMMTASKEPGKWRNAIYTHDARGGYTKGEWYLDIDFDGQFDVKYLYDDAGGLISKHIYLDKVWQKAESVEKGRAVLGEKTYVFSDDFGWAISE